MNAAEHAASSSAAMDIFSRPNTAPIFLDASTIEYAIRADSNRVACLSVVSAGAFTSNPAVAVEALTAPVVAVRFA